MKNEQLQILASGMVGDGQSPNLYFVTQRGIVVTITQDGDRAYAEWLAISRSQSPRIECALEDRKVGTLASVQPATGDDMGAGAAQRIGDMITIDQYRFWQNFQNRPV